MRLRTALFLVVALASCKENAAPASTPTPLQPKAAPRELQAKDVISMANIPQGAGDLYAVFQTSRGNIVVKLFEKDAPKTVANFVGLATGKQEWVDPRNGQKSKAKLYDGTSFHRVIPQFMIQGGDPLGTGTGRPNVGKSTLLNRLVGQKLAIVSPKPQTTRGRILGVITRPDAQVALLDTPGLHTARGGLNARMVDQALHTLVDADVALFLIEAGTPAIDAA